VAAPVPNITEITRGCVGWISLPDFDQFGPYWRFSSHIRHQEKVNAADAQVSPAFAAR
jgi:hypothetical protein